MNRQEHLLLILAEECAEVAQRASKAMRFGIDEIQPGQPLTNGERITQEFEDLIAMFQMLNLPAASPRAIQEKKAKVEKFLRYSEECGTLTQNGGAVEPEEKP